MSERAYLCGAGANTPDRDMVLGGTAVMLHASRDEIEAAGKKLIERAVESAGTPYACFLVTRYLAYSIYRSSDRKNG